MLCCILNVNATLNLNKKIVSLKIVTGTAFKDWAGYKKFDTIIRNEDSSTITTHKNNPKKYLLTESDGRAFKDWKGNRFFYQVKRNEDGSTTTCVHKNKCYLTERNGTKFIDWKGELKFKMVERNFDGSTITEHHERFYMTEKKGLPFVDWRFVREFDKYISVPLKRNLDGSTVIEVVENYGYFKNDVKHILVEKDGSQFKDAMGQYFFTKVSRQLDGSTITKDINLDDSLTEKDGQLFHDWTGRSKFGGYLFANIIRNQDGSTITKYKEYFYLTEKDGSAFQDKDGNKVFENIERYHDGSTINIDDKGLYYLTEPLKNPND